MAAPSPPQPIEEASITEDERQWMIRIGKDVKNALGSMKIVDVGEVVVGFNI